MQASARRGASARPDGGYHADTNLRFPAFPPFPSSERPIFFRRADFSCRREIPILVRDPYRIYCEDPCYYQELGGTVLKKQGCPLGFLD